MNAITSVLGKAFVLPGSDIDTDEIIPARFLKCVTFDALGPDAFRDVRESSSGKDEIHPFDHGENKDGSILLVGANFGCGSSREHAPQALKYWGIKAIVGLSFAEIFEGNSVSIGLPCVTVDEKVHQTLMDILGDSSGSLWALEIKEKRLHAETLSETRHFDFNLPDSAQNRFLTNTWDSLPTLLEARDAILERISTVS